jgi:DNA helicase-2/ATP-dependent DNA helicase PcrA
VELFRPGGTGVTAVGDDAQAIYGFRAATTAAILDFSGRYPGAAVVRLEQNYRSTPPILAVANQVMAEAPEGAAKTLWSDRPGRRRPVLRPCADESTQAEAVCDAVLAHREAGVALRHQAVLFRAAHHATELELALGRRRIPYVKYGGLRFLQAAHVKDLVALLRLLDNPRDELAWFRVLQLLEGVGAATARRIIADLGVTTGGVRGAVPADPGAPTPLTRFLAAAPTVPAQPGRSCPGCGPRSPSAPPPRLRRSAPRWSVCGAGWNRSSAGDSRRPPPAAAISNGSPSRRRRRGAGAGSSPISPSTRR